jgi:hypothetical protein
MNYLFRFGAEIIQSDVALIIQVNGHVIKYWTSDGMLTDLW